MLNSLWRPIQRGIGFSQSTPPRRSVLGFIKKFLKDWSLNFAAGLAYTFLISLLPIVITAFGIFGLVFGNNPEVRQSIVNKIVDSLPDNVTKTAVQQV